MATSLGMVTEKNVDGWHCQNIDKLPSPGLKKNKRSLKKREVKKKENPTHGP